ncbi:hypothetical protein TSUD_249970 [Trifolium subterraneum]|nr:hypothetical protein TSUD_249970 [Trifolium subterraneum]
MELRFIISLSFLLLSSTSFTTESKCNKGCNLALASYTITNGVNLTYITNIMKSNVLTKPQDIIITNNKSKTKRVNVPFPCDCINGEFLAHTKVSKDYGLFITYPLRSEDSLESIAKDTKIEAGLLQRYNPGVNFSQGSGLVFIPGKDQNGIYEPLHLSKIGVVAIVGISVGVLAGLLLLSICVYIKYYLKKKAWKKKNLILDDPNMNSDQTGTHITGIIVENSLEFSYEELSIATNNFSVDNKIGEGGFGEVFYAELRGQVGLIGYCVEGFLFLVYEYIDNGNLSQNLRDLEREPLPWSTRMQIALDSARGLEYIHEHTVRVYIHRDIKYAHGAIALSPKIDVYAFGVVLYELISANPAVINDGPEVKGLVALLSFCSSDPPSSEGNLVNPKFECLPISANSYNTDTLQSPDSLLVDSRVNVPFPCACIYDEFLGLTFLYELHTGDTYASIPEFTFRNLTTKERLQRENYSRFDLLTPSERSGAIAGISAGVLAGILLSSFCAYIKYYQKKKVWKKNLTLDDSKMMNTAQIGNDITELLVEKSQEFSYKELSIATNKFSMSNKIGEGGFGEVFYAELRGQVGLIGYCVEGFLFLIYEYIDNGNLSQNLCNSERECLTWSTRMQITLDSARGLDYIHEHTVHGYIHRDIKT